MHIQKLSKRDSHKRLLVFAGRLKVGKPNSIHKGQL